MELQHDLLGDCPPPSQGRDVYDRYYTPPWMTKMLLDAIGTRLGLMVHSSGSSIGGPEYIPVIKPIAIEPCCGQGHVSDVLKASGFFESVHTSDIDPGSVAEVFMDFLNYKPFPEVTSIPKPWLISNFPYETKDTDVTKATRLSDYVKHALTLNCNVASISTVPWLEPCNDRALIFQDNPPTQMIFLPRGNFVGGGGSNNASSVWCVWDMDGIQRPPRWYNRDDKRRFFLKSVK